MYVKRSPPVQSSRIMYLMQTICRFSGEPKVTTYKNSESKSTAYTLLILGCLHQDRGISGRKDGIMHERGAGS